MPITTNTSPLHVSHVMNENIRFKKNAHTSIMINSVENHLDLIQNQVRHLEDNNNRFSDIMKFKRIGVTIMGGSTAEEIDITIREMRGNE